MRDALGLSDNEMALLQGPALALPMLIAAIPLGLVVDRYSRVRLLFVLVALITLGSALTAWAGNFLLLFAARGLVGVAAFAMAPVALSLLADLYEPAQRGRANMVITIGQFAGSGIVFALGGVLLTTASSSSDAWRWAMLWLTAPLVLVACAMLAMREPPRTGRVIENPSTRQSFVELWRYRAVIAPVLAGIVMAEIILQSVMIWVAPTLARNFALTPDRVGAIIAVAVPIGGIVGTIAGGLCADFCHRSGGPRKTLSVLAVLAILCAPASLFAVASGVMSASVLFTLTIAVVNTALVMGLTLFAIVIPNELRGLATGVLTGAGVVLAVGVTPLLVSGLSGALGGPETIGKSLAVVSIAASILSAAAFASGRRHFPGKAPQ